MAAPQSAVDEVIDVELNQRKDPESMHPIRRFVETGAQEWNPYREKLVWLNKKIAPISTFLTVVNSLTIAISTSGHFTVGPKALSAIEVIDLCFLWFFTIELFLNFLEHGFYILKDPWLCLDFFVVAISWLEVLFADNGNFTILRSLRILRVLRILGRSGTLKTLIDIICSVVPELFGIVYLVLLVIFIFAVLMTNMFGDAYVCHATEIDLFGDFMTSFLTLFQLMTFDNWSDIMRGFMNYKAASVEELSPEMVKQCAGHETVWKRAWVPFVIYVVLSGFVFFNLGIAVISDSTAVLQEKRAEEREARKREKNQIIEKVDVTEDMDSFSKRSSDSNSDQAGKNGLEEQINVLEERLNEVLSILRQNPVENSRSVGVDRAGEALADSVRTVSTINVPGTEFYECIDESEDPKGGWLRRNLGSFALRHN